MTGIGKPPEQHVKSSDISKSCADPGSFVRGGATKLCRRFFAVFFSRGKDPNTTKSWPSSARQRNVSVAGR